MSAKMELKFTGMNEYIRRLQRMDKDIKRVTENALKASSAEITPGIHKGIAPHNLTGATEESIVNDKKVEWTGEVAEVKVGFSIRVSIRDGGLASIFLMYGTPTIEPDMELYDSIYGSRTKSKVRKKQKEVFEKGILRG